MKEVGLLWYGTSGLPPLSRSPLEFTYNSVIYQHKRDFDSRISISMEICCTRSVLDLSVSINQSSSQSKKGTTNKRSKISLAVKAHFVKCSPAPVTWDKVNWKPWSESWFEDAELNSLSQGNVNWLRKRKRPTVRKKRLLPYRRWKLSLVNQVRFSVSSWSQSKSIRLWKNLEVGVGGARLEVKNLLQAKLLTLKSTLS